MHEQCHSEKRAAPKGRGRMLLAVQAEMADVVDETFNVGCTVECVLQGVLGMLAGKIC